MLAVYSFTCLPSACFRLEEGCFLFLPVSAAPGVSAGLSSMRDILSAYLVSDRGIPVRTPSLANRAAAIFLEVSRSSAILSPRGKSGWSSFSLDSLPSSFSTGLNKNDFRGLIRIVQTASDSAEIKLFSSNGTPIKNPGGAQETTMYMSLLFAISDLTTLKREEDYPLIFDAPTSSFENFKENVFYNIIDKIQKQCIIVTKDLLEVDKLTGKKTLNEAQIEALTCSVYRIEKQTGYNETDLSTIRTIITPIK